MTFILIILVTLNFVSAHTDNFEKEAKSLATDLKISLMKNFSEKMAKDGPEKAVCLEYLFGLKRNTD